MVAMLALEDWYSIGAYRLRDRCFCTRGRTGISFQSCLPLSLLLQTSNGFFMAAKSLVSLTQVLEATCAADFNTCSPLMASLAQQLEQESNCGADLQMQNPTVLQAYDGLVAFQPLYQAGCLKDTDGAYCLANAMTNTSAPTSSYIYYLALGMQLPANTRPACTDCLRNTMAIFATAATNRSVPLNEDYAAAAQQVDASCGSEFAQASVVRSSAVQQAAHMSKLVLIGFVVLAIGILA
ncbi:hypothetical protein LTR22_013871 [Elasticomyces elasticus]|nr:hypothetical protein LTR22_013871 [Elasticomyces elasticus]KAK4913826.1 hypothetical protein LTR49_017862 [Elasticomyces elasticus]